MKEVHLCRVKPRKKRHACEPFAQKKGGLNDQSNDEEKKKTKRNGFMSPRWEAQMRASRTVMMMIKTREKKKKTQSSGCCVSYMAGGRKF
jgi:hypothetical protein